MTKSNIDISIIVTAHNEGRLAHRTMRSILRAVALAEKAGIKCQIIAVLDNPSGQTSDYFDNFNDSRLQVEKVNYADPGPSRNHGVALASGKYVALLDADDLFGSSWLMEAYRLAEKSKEDCVYYPQYVILFEGANVISRYIGSSDDDFDFSSLIEFNSFNSVHFFTKRSFLLSTPFIEAPLASGFGFEDWHWYCEVLAKGIEIKIVPETSVFCRRKEDQSSRLAFHHSHNVMCPPSKLFSYEIFNPLCRGQEEPLKVKKPLSSGITAKILNSIEKRINPFLPLIPYSETLRRIVRRLRMKPLQVPVWLLEEWKRLNTIEPLIFPDRYLLETIRVYKSPNSRIGRPYLELCELYGQKVSHVFLIPWLKRGGSDLVTINYIQALAENGLANGITVIADKNSDSPWADKLPESVNFIEFGRMYPDLKESEKEKLLSKLLAQMAPQVIHNINSNLGYRIFIKYGKALSRLSNLYATTFCAEYSKEGKLAGYPFTCVPYCYDNLRALLSENRAILDQLKELYCLDKKMYVHYTPAKVGIKKEYVDKIGSKGRLDVLWAGRIDLQKRPDILIQIARKCTGLPFKFHVYGAALLSKDIYTKKLKELENVEMYGSFDGISSLPVQNFDVLLFTSQWEGLPTTLIEMISLGLPIIASKVGGIPELIIDNETGYLIDPYDDADQFVQRLKKLYNDRSDLPRILDNAYNLVVSRHSWEHFLSDIKQTPGYIVINQGDRLSAVK